MMSKTDLAEPVDIVELGEIIGGYRLTELLGAGATSQVFLGIHVRLGRKTAVKVLSPRLVDDQDILDRLFKEAKVVNDIRHPNIIDISDFVETEQPRRVALIMEYIEGPSLRVLRDNPLGFGRAVGVALQLVAAVQAAHRAGVVHRDIKPDNLLLTVDPADDEGMIPWLKVVDFGIAKIAGPSLGLNPATGVMIGTPAYMAPEQIAGTPPPSAATDVYAIGEVLYELLTGKRAFLATSLQEVVRKKLRKELPNLSMPGVPEAEPLLSLIERSLSPTPAERPTLDEVRQTLIAACPQHVLQVGSGSWGRITSEPELSTVRNGILESVALEPTTIGPELIATIGAVPTADTKPMKVIDTAETKPPSPEIKPPDFGAIAKATTAAEEPPRVDIAHPDFGAASTAETKPNPVDLEETPAANESFLFLESKADPPTEPIDPAETDPPDLPPTVVDPGAPTVVDPGAPPDLPPTVVDPGAQPTVVVDTPDNVDTNVVGLETQLAPTKPKRTPLSFALMAAAAAVLVAVMVMAVASLQEEPAPTSTLPVDPMVTPRVTVSETYVRITSEPEGASVLHEDNLLGETPISVELTSASETKKLEVTKPGYRARFVEVTGSDKKISVVLTKATRSRRATSKRPKSKRDPKPSAVGPIGKERDAVGPIGKEEFPEW